MKVSELVKRKSEAEFIQDVQLRWYVSSSEENLSLVNNFLFTRQKIPTYLSPVDVLYKTKQALLQSIENRFMVIATYGHGKSHLALALANYFGKSFESKECSTILKSLKRTFDKDSELTSYIEFKRNRKRTLVICLDGTRPGSLQQLFLQSLSSALQNENETKGQQLPFWTKDALDILEDIDSKDLEREQANSFLKTSNLDLILLCDKLRTQNTDHYELIRELVYQVRGVRPDLGGEESLAYAVEWAVDNYCGSDDDKPFSGLLILFDEFSAFLRYYSRRLTQGSPLQDLLDGISSRKSLSAFVAFGQSDPTSTVNSVFAQIPNEESKDALLLELNRIPTTHRFQLYTAMEHVLDSYLSQDIDALKNEFSEGSASHMVVDANDDCYKVFSERYENELEWDIDFFETRVTYGCYPLNPFTTALLCNISLLEAADPRSVLGFVINGITAVNTENIVNDCVPTWIYAVALVDNFNEQLADEEWRQFVEAKRIRGGDLTDEEHLVLKAMLLHTIGNMPTSCVAYHIAIARLTGLNTSKAKSTLKDLSALGVIEHQIEMEKYTFWSIGKGAHLLHEWMNTNLEGKELSPKDLEYLNKSSFDPIPQFQPVSVAWGHRDDWQAAQIFVTKAFFNGSFISHLANHHRGTVVWCLAATDEDVEWFENVAKEVIDDSTGSPPLPIIFNLPKQAHPELLAEIQKYCLLGLMPINQASEFGDEVITTVRNKLFISIKNERGGPHCLDRWIEI